MTPVYTNKGYWWRNTGSIAVLVVIALYGLFEVWKAATVAGATQDGYLWGFGFSGGAVWGGWQLLQETRDRVMGYSRDAAANRSEVTLWRPFTTERLAGGADALTDWRLHISIGKRNLRTFFMYADHKDYPRPLVFDLRIGLDLTGLQAVAPEAMAEFRRATGPKPG